MIISIHTKAANSVLFVVFLFTQISHFNGTITQIPPFACEGESITVTCVLTPPGAEDVFAATKVDFIVGELDVAISESIVNTAAVFNNIDFSRFTADAPDENLSYVTGSITLLSFDSTDVGLRIGCGINNRPGGSGSVPYIETLALVQAGSSISFSPDSPLCIGEEVEMVCFVESSVQFRVADALVSFNNSFPLSISQLNSNNVMNSIDLSRYKANLDGLSISKSRPGIRLIINSYQLSDSATLFGCHGEFVNFTLSPALVSGQSNEKAAPPPAPSMLSISSSNIYPNTCSAATITVSSPLIIAIGIIVIILFIAMILIAVIYSMAKQIKQLNSVSKEATSKEAPSKAAPSKAAPSKAAPSKEAPSKAARSKETASKAAPFIVCPSKEATSKAAPFIAKRHLLAMPTCTMITSSPLIIAIAIIGLLLFIAVIIIVMLLFVIIKLCL